MRPVVSRPARSQSRFIGLACILAVLAAACGGAIPAPEVQTPEGRRFIPLVPDSIDNVGLAPSVAVDAQGLPVISYFGFPAVLEEGEIPVARPVGSPFLTTEDGDDAGAVLLASVTPDQIWTRGAIAQPRETPGGVPVPFEPVDRAVARLADPGGRRGDRHRDRRYRRPCRVDHGRRRVLRPRSEPFENEPVEETEGAGAPSIVVDGAGAPIVAYTVAGPEPEVRVAEQAEDGWTTTPVTTLTRCNEGCSPPTQVALVGGEPLVVVTDPVSGDVIAARRQGDAWTTEVVATGSTGGASLATSGDTASIAFSTASGVCARDRPVRLVVGRGRRSDRGGGRGSGDLRRADAAHHERRDRRGGHHVGRMAGRRGDPSRLQRRRRVRGDRAPRHERRTAPEPRRHGGRRIRLPGLVRLDRGGPPARHVRGDRGPADRGAAAAPVGRPAAELGVRRGRSDRPRYRGARHRVRSDLPGRSGRGGLHDQLRQQGSRRDRRSAQHRDRRR